MTSLVNDQTQPGAPMSPQGRSASCLVVLGTGGTISGKAGSARDNVGYSAGLVGVSDLLDGVPGLDALTGRGLRLEAEQLAQIDSKDMSHAVWRRLAERVAAHLAREDVGGVVITHGTDTMAYTASALAFCLSFVPAPSDKPLDTVNGIFGIRDGLTLCQLTDQAIAGFTKANHTGSCPSTFCIGDHQWLTAL